MYAPPVNFARVVLPSPLRDPLIYAIPVHLRNRIATGMRVLLPLGNRKVTGVILELLETTSIGRTRPILGLPDDSPVLDSQLLDLIQWAAGYYLATVGEVLATVLPPSLRRESDRRYVLLRDNKAAEHPLDEEILGLLRQRKRGISVKALTQRIASDEIHEAIARLESCGAVDIKERVPRNRWSVTFPALETSFRAVASVNRAVLKLTAEQRSAIAAIERRSQGGGFEVFLLHGVTGSGKTEVYIRAMERAHELGYRSLVLIPEISLTPQLIDRVGSRFPGRVGILHSDLTERERALQWWRIVRGEVDVVIGARSAVFAPLPSIGLIVVDEEHDPSFKQEDGLHYNGRDVAVMRGKLLGCPVILGSATPSVESYENCRQGRYRLLEMTARVQSRPLPKVETVDLSRRSKLPGTRSAEDSPIISSVLIEALRANYSHSRQSLIFLNRRGFANFLQCQVCGNVVRCARCSVTLTLHMHRKSLSCHHCNFQRPVIEICPECSNSALTGIGSGTEQIEQVLQRIVPGARVARMDRDTTTKRGSQETLIRRWERGEIDILVGTQMITKGHDVRGVTLVGALLADMSLNLPDFRAAERTFQILSQVAGRSGRGDDPGRVIIQTYAPGHYTMKHLVRHDYAAFFGEELEFRRALNYPPFSRLICLRVDGPKLDKVQAAIMALALDLRARIAENGTWRKQIEILGPAPAPILKLRGQYRWQLLLKSKHRGPLLDLASRARDLLPRSRGSRLHIDVDPYSML